MLWGIALAVAATAVLHFAMLCYVILEKQRFPIDPRFESVHPDADAIPPAVRDFWSSLSRFAETQGFVPVGYVYQQDTGGPVVSYVAIFHQPDERHALIGAFTSGPVGGSYIEYHTETLDDRTILTNNAAQIGCFPAAPRHSSAWLPMVSDFDRLFRIHRTRLARLGHPACKPPEVRSATEFMTIEWARPFHRLARRGWLRLLPDGQTYQSTIRGAIGMALRLVWPVHLARKALRQVAGHVLIQRLGV